jgi:hypothetical protein
MARINMGIPKLGSTQIDPHTKRGKRARATPSGRTVTCVALQRPL